MKILKMLAAGAMLLGAASVHAETASVVVTDVDGGTTRILLCDGMSGSYATAPGSTELDFEIRSGQFIYDADGNYVPDTSSENPGVVHLSMPVYKVSGLVFHGVNTALEGIEADDTLTIDLNAGRLVFRGVVSPVSLTVSSLDGRLELARTVSSDTEIDIAAFGAGVHLVKAGDRTFKIMVK